MIDLVPYAPGMLERLEPGPFDRRLMAEPAFQALRESFDGLAAVRDGRPLGFFFMAQMDATTGRPFILASDALRRDHKLFLGLMARRGVAYGAAAMGLTRLLAEAYLDDATAQRWLAWLGFAETGRDAAVVHYEREC